MRLPLLLIILMINATALPQQPFDLDTTFRTDLESWYVNSILPLEDGRLIASGRFRLPDDPVGDMRSLARINVGGSLDQNYPSIGGSGKLIKWQDKFYAQNHHLVRRLLMNGSPDPSFILMNSGPYFSSFQGGDYHVYPDGRVLMSGLHALSDTIRGFTGDHCLIWFSNEGYLDTTQHHRKCWGSLDFFRELPDGKFIGSGSTSIWDGQPASNIIRFHADGALDTTFQAHVWWGQAYGFLPLEDGRVYAAGIFRIEGISDTLRLVRFMPDGSLDPTFNNTIKFRITEMTTQPLGGLPRRIHPLGEDRLIITGSFEKVEDEVRRCIVLLDTNGNVLNDHFVDAGVGNFTYQGATGSVTSGIAPAPDGNHYIWGAYHGYNDGNTNDPQQRFISRLYGLNVGVQEQNKEEPQLLKVYPNPAQDQVTFVIDPAHVTAGSKLVVRDPMGREVYVRRLRMKEDNVVWDTRGLAAGTYTATMENGTFQGRGEKLVIDP